MSAACEGTQRDSHDVKRFNVVVPCLPPLRTRCEETWTRLWRGFWGTLENGLLTIGIDNYPWPIILLVFLVAVAVVLVILVWWIMISACHHGPGMALEALSIRNLTVFQNDTVATTPDSPWQVNSAFNVTLSTWNRNKVAGCRWDSYHRMIVNVKYRGQSILQQEIPLCFRLSRRGNRVLTIEPMGDHVQLEKELGPVMEAELRSANITFDFYFDIQYVRIGRRLMADYSNWVSLICLEVVKRPSNSIQVGSNLLWKQCNITYWP